MNIPRPVAQLFNSLAELNVPADFLQKAAGMFVAGPPHPGPWVELAAALRKNGHYHGAMETYDVALAMFPKSDCWMLWSNRGNLLLLWERYQEALQSFSNALAIRPTYARALFCRGQTYERMHRFRKAASAYKAVIRLDPEDQKAWNNLGLCHDQLGRVCRATVAYRRALELDPNSEDSLFNMAALLSRKRDFSGAKKCIDRLIQVRPDDDVAQEVARQIERHEAVTPQVPPIYSTRNVYRITQPTAGEMNQVTAESFGVYYTVHGPEGNVTGITAPNGETRDKVLFWKLAEEALKASKAIAEPRFFVSYRWESAEHVAWTDRFVTDLVRNGYDVVYDRLEVVKGRIGLEPGPAHQNSPSLQAFYNFARSKTLQIM